MSNFQLQVHGYLKPHWILSSALLLSFAGCSSLPDTSLMNKPKSHAITDHKSTSTAEFLEPVIEKNPGMSGFTLLRDGQNSFTARLTLIDQATRSLDLQYYIWASDATGRILAERLVRAADRGVRVRILIDDNNNIGRDSALASLSAHQNIEIRIFNPFSGRNSHLWDFIVDFDRVNHRMHNKILVMDNTVAIVGGRNIGDHYFNVDEHANFRDLDVCAVGPIVPEVSGTFDSFWNGQWAVPIENLVEKKYSIEDLKAKVSELRKTISSTPYPYPLEENIDLAKSQLGEIRDNFVWGKGLVVHDNPDKLLNSTSDTLGIKNRLINKLPSIKTSLHIESAYFVPNDAGVEQLIKLAKRGVTIKILTNSLSTNDVLAAHAGYAKFREQLLEKGIELFELKTDGDSDSGKVAIITYGKSKASLHTKAFAFDDDSVFIGSFNLDPRSANINTELGIYIENKELTKQLKDYMASGFSRASSYQVKLDENDKLYWLTNTNGEPEKLNLEPQTTGWQRFLSWLLKLLPIESQL
ncbi:phospholipase D family protein [Porticoccaceae bacterium LTM1]|nr:phospholipase D family protein [Porticoccaceae bacterium LTM1]